MLTSIKDHIKLVTIFIQHVHPNIEPPTPNPGVQYCQEIFPILDKIAELFPNCSPILERVCHCWRHMVLSYRSSMVDLLPILADKLVTRFASSRQGCFLWATDSVVREFSEGADRVDANTSEAIFNFSEQQATTFLRTYSEYSADQLPDSKNSDSAARCTQLTPCASD